MIRNQEKADDRYTPESLMRYHAAAAVAENMETEGLITPSDKRKIIDALSRKYGFKKHSIFAI